MIYNVKTPVVETDYLAGSKPSNCIPSDAPLNEMMYYVLEANEQNYNEMMKNIGINELDYFVENGVELEYTVNEASLKDINQKSKDIFNGMVDLLKKAWSGIQEAIKKAIQWLGEQSAKVSANALKGLNDKKYLADKVKEIKDDKNFGTMYKYTNLDKYIDKGINEIASNATAATERFVSAVSNQKDAYSKEKMKELTDGLNEDVNKVFSKFCGDHKVTNASEMKKYIKDDMRGEKSKVDGKWVKENWSNIMLEVTKYPESKKKLNSTYNSAKKVYNGAIKECDKSFKELQNKGIFDASAFIAAGHANQKMLNAVTVAGQAVIECLTERFRTYASIVTRVASAARSAKAAEEKVQHNSAMLESSSSTIDMLNSLFNW